MVRLFTRERRWLSLALSQVEILARAKMGHDLGRAAGETSRMSLRGQHLSENSIQIGRAPTKKRSDPVETGIRCALELKPRSILDQRRWPSAPFDE